MHLLGCFGSFLWVLECFNHSMKTMPCNLAGQKLFTQPTCYSKVGIHSFTFEHQFLKTGFMKLGIFNNMISKWSLCRLAQAHSESHKTLFFFLLWVVLITYYKMFYHHFLQRLIKERVSYKGSDSITVDIIQKRCTHTNGIPILRRHE